MPGPIDLEERTIRAERFVLDVARVLKACVHWRKQQTRSLPGRPIARDLVVAVDQLPEDWEQIVREMGEDIEEYPLDGTDS